MGNAKKLKNTSKEHLFKKCPAAVTCSSTVRKKNENNIQSRIKTNNSGKKLLMQRKSLRGVPKLNRRYFSEEYTSFDSVKAKQFQYSGTYEKKNSLKKLKATVSNQVMTMKKAEIPKSSINKTNDSVKKLKSEEIVTRNSKGKNFQDSQTPEKKNSLKTLPKVTVSIQVIPVKKAKLLKSGISKTNDSVKKLKNEEMVLKRKVTQNLKVDKSKNIKNENDLKEQPIAVPAAKIKKNREILVASTRNKNNTLSKSKNNLIMKGNSIRIRKINKKYCSEEYSSLLSVKVDKSKNIKNKNDLKKQPVAVPAVKIKKNREILVASTRNKNNTLPKSKNNLIMKENSTRIRKINQKYCSEEYSSLLPVKVAKSRKRKIENDLEKQLTAVPTAKIRKGLKISMTGTTNRNNETPKLKNNLIVKENPTRIRKINQKYYSGEYSSLFSANLNNSKVSIVQSESNLKKKAGVDSTDSSHKVTSKKTLAITNMKKTNDSKNLKKITINTDVVKRAPKLNRKYFSEEFSSHSLSQKKKSEDSDIYEDKHSSKNSNTGSLVSKKNSNILVAGEKKPKFTLQKSPSKLLIKKRELGRTRKTNRKYASEEYVSNLSAQRISSGNMKNPKKQQVVKKLSASLSAKSVTNKSERVLNSTHDAARKQSEIMKKITKKEKVLSTSKVSNKCSMKKVDSTVRSHSKNLKIPNKQHIMNKSSATHSAKSLDKKRNKGILSTAHTIAKTEISKKLTTKKGKVLPTPMFKKYALNKVGSAAAISTVTKSTNNLSNNMDVKQCWVALQKNDDGMKEVLDHSSKEQKSSLLGETLEKISMEIREIIERSETLSPHRKATLITAYEKSPNESVELSVKQ